MPVIDLPATHWGTITLGALLGYWLVGLLYWLFAAADMGWRPRPRNACTFAGDLIVLACLACVWPFEWWDNRQGRRS